MSPTSHIDISIDPKPCEHFEDYKRRHNGYSSIQNFIKTTPSGRASIKKNETEIPKCDTCSGYQGRLYLCLICHSILCPSHALSHSQSANGHDVAVDIERAELYCCLCRDQLYDSDFDWVVVSKNRMNLPRTEDDESVVERPNKRRRLCSKAQLDSTIMKRLVSTRIGRVKCCLPLGLRGFVNMGNTCFMNSVMQALLHAPPFRNYFLNDQHNRETCPSNSKSNQDCFLCAVDATFSAMYSGDLKPYKPDVLLCSLWMNSTDFAYEQQDAHEFFISMLNLIHEREGKLLNLNEDNKDCNCISHRVFYGLFKSDQTCVTCGYTSTTYDPYGDISLNFEDEGKKSTEYNEKTATSTLIGCLDMFTRPEKLGSDCNFHCPNCCEKRDSLKQLSIRRLPLVLCLHIKRFGVSKKGARKLDHHLKFPFSLDMSPYLSSSIIRKKFGNRIFAFNSNDFDTSTDYEIFAVVTHFGTLQSGHYITYLRLRNKWYICNDARISEVDEQKVRDAQCYMMFYVQKMLYYQGNCDLDCHPEMEKIKKLASETKEAPESHAGKELPLFI